MYDAYRTYLAGHFRPDYWSGEGIDQAADRLTHFATPDWTRLSAKWSEQSVEWKVRCAQTLDTGLPDHGCAVLLEMLRDPDPEVIVVAADSLRSWPKGATGLTPTEADRPQAFAKARGGIDAMAVGDLLAKG